jgi:hypothetical protein
MFVANLHNVTITHLPTGTVILNFVVCFWIFGTNWSHTLLKVCCDMRTFLYQSWGVQLIESLYRSVPRCLTHICRFTVRVEKLIIKLINTCSCLHLCIILWNLLPFRPLSNFHSQESSSIAISFHFNWFLIN